MKTTKNTRNFFILTFLVSWLVWVGMLVFPPSEKWFIPLLFLGAFGPSLAAVLLVQAFSNPAEKKDFWKRVVDIKRIGWNWLLFILSIFPAILVIGYSLLFILGEEIPDLSTYFNGLDSLESVAFFLIFMLLGGPLAEELGWRGYILDALQQNWGKFKGSMILGFVWVVWHLPLFFIEGTSQHQKGFGIAFWSWSLQIMMLSVLFTWMYNRTQRSILAAILLHFMANFAYPLNLDAQGELIFSLVRVIIITPILISWYKSSGSKRIEAKAAVNLS